MNESSVYQLVTTLCASLIKESEGLSLNSAKSSAFKILLNSNCQNIPEDENLAEELQFASFELSLANRDEDSKSVGDLIEHLSEKTKEFEAVCWLLVHLKNIDPDPQSGNHREVQNFFEIPSELQLFNRKNVYLPKKSQKLIKLPLATSKLDDDCSFFSSILNSYTGDNKKKRGNQLMNLSLTPTKAPETKPTVVRKQKLINTWENLGNIDFPNKSFSSDSSIPIHNRLMASNTKHPAEIKTISFEDLLHDLKLLAIGIESESFKRALDDPLTFQKPTQLSSDDISDVSQYVEEFIEIGTCFKRLKTFTSKNPFNQSYIFEGFIFKAFCDCIIKFMNHYRDIIDAQQVESLLEFSANTKNIRRILIHIAKFLKIHPSSTCRSMLPTGSDFLGLLYTEYTTIFNLEVKCFFVDCLKCCCQIYFNNFHRWLFHGHIDDPHKELFIYFVDHYRPNTKYFFDKAYLIRKQSVPGFLQGCADNILLCGKYTMLLKSFNQVHPLFMLQKPSLKVCLTNEEIIEMREQCKEFIKSARTACGPSISIEKLMNERAHAKREKYKKAEAASTVNAKRWRQEQTDRRTELAAKRELQQQGLRDELQRIEENKVLKRIQSIQTERDYLDEAEEFETQALERENTELENRIRSYKQLNEQIDEGNEKRDKLVTKLRNTLKSKEGGFDLNESIEDVVNANESSPSKKAPVTDAMNNVIPKTTITEGQRNKIKILSHEYNIISTEVGEEDNGNQAIPSTEQPISEAQKDKSKILRNDNEKSTESSDTISTEATKTVQIQKNLLNLETDDVFTQAKKNKLKMMSHETEVTESVTTTPAISVQNFETLTDLQKNRLKVMSHEYHLEKDVPLKPKKKLSLNLLQVEIAQQHLESPMSVTSDHFSNESEVLHADESHKSIDDDMQKSQIIADDEDQEMLKAFEEAIAKNLSMFMGINLNNVSEESSSVSNYSLIKTTDTMALSRFLQMSVMEPVNTYMDILNNETLKIFVQDLDILSHFKSLRNYFLMMNGEFGSSICHQLFSKLETGVKPSELLNYQSLHMILDHALSQSRSGINTDKLSFIVNNIPEKFDLHSPAVLNMLTMSYKLEWPLNLILNPETMDQYQAIFNYLLKLKRISWVLEECFQILKDVRKEHGKELLNSQQFRNVQQIRHKMTHFVHCLENHVTRNVLQISWISFAEDLKSAQSIHCIYRKHTNYLKRVLFLCLLNKKSFEFQKTIEDSFKVILRFHKHLKAKEWLKAGNPKYHKIESDAEDFERLIKYVMYLGNKIVQHGYQKEIYDLLYLIDINCYYSKD